MEINNKHDLVIRNGKIIDGSGSKPFFADIAIDDGIITSVGKINSSGNKELDAKGNLVTPGWVDIHTHYDGQVSWDPYLTPSSLHGVTTAVMGNCGVGFAPVRPGDESFLIQLMEGVEDIPGSALHEGIDWAQEGLQRRNCLSKLLAQVVHDCPPRLKHPDRSTRVHERVRGSGRPSGRVGRRVSRMQQLHHRWALP